MKLLPSRPKAPAAASRATSEPITNGRPCARAVASTRSYKAASFLTSHGLLWTPRLISHEARTGTTVSDNSSDEASAKTMVNATGPNILPSSPCKVRSGRKTRMMMTMPEATGAATSRVARKTRCRVGRLPGAACSPPASWLSTFSTTTTAASTSMPMAMARPPRLIRLADSPKARIRMKVASAESGSINATTSAARRLPRKARSRSTTSTMASSSALDTVPTARSTRLERS